jgi:hypothetical protein
MKKILSGIVVSLILATTINASDKAEVNENEMKMPENVKAVVEKSCFGCHNTDSRNEDAKEDLDFKTLNDLSLIKKIGTLRDIAEVVEEDEMPPKKFLDRYPDRAPTDEEKEILVSWVKKEVQKLIDSQ